MKKNICIYIMLALCVSLLLMAGCQKQGGQGDKTAVFYDHYMTDDTKTLEEALTKEYDLDALRAFFESSKENERIGLDSEGSLLSFGEVNEQFPIEVIRSGGYSVYQVSQGGYFYVFWVKPFDGDPDSTDLEPSVYFSAYLPSGLDPSAFDSLTPGVSTAEDVKSIDPSFELNFLQSRGTFSYSFLSEESVLEIEYTITGEGTGYKDLVVKSMTVEPREDSPSRYGAILPMDLPG